MWTHVSLQAHIVWEDVLWQAILIWEEDDPESRVTLEKSGRVPLPADGGPEDALSAAVAACRASVAQIR